MKASRATGLENCIAIALLISLVVSAILASWGAWRVDFAAYYMAADLILHGQADEIFNSDVAMIISGDMGPAWKERMAHHGAEGRPSYPFIYPAWFAYAFTVVPRFLDPLEAMNMALIVNTGLMVLCGVFAFRAIRPEPLNWARTAMFFVFLFFTSLPTVFALTLGQIQILVTLLCLMALERDRAGHRATAGVLLAVAACIKITPAAFALIFLLDRNWRALAAFTITSAAFVAVSLLAIDPALHMAFIARVREIDAHVIISVGGMSMESVLYQIADLLSAPLPSYSGFQAYFEKPEWIGFATKGLLLLSIGLVVWRWRRDADPKTANLRAWFALSIAVPVFGPLGWAHYYLMTSFMLPALLVLVSRRTAWRLIAVYSAVFFNITHFMLLPEGWPVIVQPLMVVPVLLIMLGFVLLKRPEFAKAPRPQLQPA